MNIREAISGILDGNPISLAVDDLITEGNHGKIKLGHGRTVTIYVPQKVETRLKGTCFREERKAGVFSKWKTLSSILSDTDVISSLKLHLNDIITEAGDKAAGTHSITFESTKPIGWSSTIKKTKARGKGVMPEVVETRNLNKRAKADFIPASIDIKAPLTNLATFIFQLKKEGYGNWKALLWSLYPGKDVGELKGNVSEREGIYFFDWDHLGV